MDQKGSPDKSTLKLVDEASGESLLRSDPTTVGPNQAEGDESVPSKRDVTETELDEKKGPLLDDNGDNLPSVTREQEEKQNPESDDKKEPERSEDKEVSLKTEQQEKTNPKSDDKKELERSEDKDVSLKTEQLEQQNPESDKKEPEGSENKDISPKTDEQQEQPKPESDDKMEPERSEDKDVLRKTVPQEKLKPDSDKEPGHGENKDVSLVTDIPEENLESKSEPVPEDRDDLAQVTDKQQGNQEPEEKKELGENKGCLEPMSKGSKNIWDTDGESSRTSSSGDSLETEEDDSDSRDVIVSSDSSSKKTGKESEKQSIGSPTPSESFGTDPSEMEVSLLSPNSGESLSKGKDNQTRNDSELESLQTQNPSQSSTASKTDDSPSKESGWESQPTTSKSSKSEAEVPGSDESTAVSTPVAGASGSEHAISPRDVQPAVPEKIPTPGPIRSSSGAFFSGEGYGRDVLPPPRDDIQSPPSSICNEIEPLPSPEDEDIPPIPPSGVPSEEDEVFLPTPEAADNPSHPPSPSTPQQIEIEIGDRHPEGAPRVREPTWYLRNPVCAACLILAIIFGLFIGIIYFLMKLKEGWLNDGKRDGGDPDPRNTTTPQPLLS